MYKITHFPSSDTRDPRTRTRFFANACCRDKDTRSEVVDLSSSGLALRLFSDIQAAPGQEIIIDSPELGHLTGKVCWRRDDRIGVQLTPSTNLAAKIASYFRYFHDNPDRRLFR